jgi:hypothetical protein
VRLQIACRVGLRIYIAALVVMAVLGSADIARAAA